MSEAWAMGDIGLISNTRSQKNSKGMVAIDTIVSRWQNGVRHVKLDDLEALSSAIDQLARAGVAVVAINGGDGTVQAVLTDLLERRPFGVHLPLICVLPRGMTNSTAIDLGPRGRAAASLSRLIARRESIGPREHVEWRAVLRVENIAGLPPQRAMTFGSAGVIQGIEVCRQRAHSMGFEGDLANAVTLLSMFGRWIVSGGQQSDVRGEPITISVDGGVKEHGDRFLVLATTLNRLILGSKPFWNTESGPIHFTTIAHPPPRLVRSAWRVLYGGNDRHFPNGAYFSRGAHRIELDMTSQFTLDGQMFLPEPEKPIIVTAPEDVPFVRV